MPAADDMVTFKLDVEETTASGSFIFPFFLTICEEIHSINDLNAP